MTFYVGQRVICVTAIGDDNSYGETFPIVGGIYTIRDIMWNGEQLLRFEEIINLLQEYAEGVDECNFYACNFRPLLERKTDISIFKAMLNASPASHRTLIEG